MPRDSARGGDDGPSRASPPVRISLAFDGDPAKLDFDDRAKLRLAKALTVNGLPYASLLYVWMNDGPVETVLLQPAHRARAPRSWWRAASSALDQWVTVRRNVLEDYRRAFGEEPGDIVAVGLMTDFGDNGAPRRALLRRHHLPPEPGSTVRHSSAHRVDVRATCSRRHARVLRAVQAQRVLQAAELAVGVAAALGERGGDQAELGGHAEQRDVAEVAASETRCSCE